MNTAEMLLDLLQLRQRLESAVPAHRTAIARAYQSQLVSVQRRTKELFNQIYTEQELLRWAESIKSLKKKRAKRGG